MYYYFEEDGMRCGCQKSLCLTIQTVLIDPNQYLSFPNSYWTSTINLLKTPQLQSLGSSSIYLHHGLQTLGHLGHFIY